MQVIQNPSLLNGFIKEYGLNTIFSTDMLHRMFLLSCIKGDYVCRYGDKPEAMFFLVKGKLKIYTVLENGRSLLLRFNSPLNVVGDMEFLSGYSVRCNVEAVSDSILIGLNYEDIHRYSYQDPGFLRFLVKNLSHKLYTVSNATSLNLLYPVENRFASYLISTAVKKDNALYVEEIKTSKLTDIATLLGTTYRHLNRVINNLIANNLIKKEKRSIIIRDLDGLKELSRGNLYE